MRPGTPGLFQWAWYSLCMITPSHIIYSWAASKYLDTKLGIDKTRIAGAVVGGFLPDLPAYVFFFYTTFIMNASQQQIWGDLYFNSGWSPFITLSHSFILWPFLLLLAHFLGKKFFFWVAGSALLQCIMDFTVHNDDAYKHFWPVSNWRFESPLSYWDPAHYGNIVGSLDTIVVLLLLIYIMKRTDSIKTQRLLVGISIIYILLTILPYFIF